MHDLRFIRDNSTDFDIAMARRGLSPQSADILSIDEDLRNTQTSMQELQSVRNTKSKEIGGMKASGDESGAEAIMAEVSAMKEELARLEQKERESSDVLNSILMQLPNIMFDEVVDGADEGDNVELRVVGDIDSYDFEPKEHWELGEDLGMMDFDYATKISGARFVSLNRGLAKLERALGNFMLDMHTNEHGYSEYQTPVLVRENALLGTGQLPKFEDDLFKTGDHYLIPTAEVTLTNIANDTIFAEKDLPKRLTAWTLCFRSEAGSAGRDTRGMLRQHQFYKVEMVSITTPEQSEVEHERMTGCAENVLKALNIPYRVMVLCTGDTSFSAKKTYDLEAWIPGHKTYREISSCSNCGDFQARRMKGRMRINGKKGTQYVHTLNGSGLATGRTLIAVMENNQNADGSITVPEVLRPYMGGMKVISKEQ